MKCRDLPIVLILAAGLAGCGGGSTPDRPGPESPHGGKMVPLPEGKGIVEVLKESAPGKAGRSVLVIYFLDNDRKPMAGAPTTASFKGTSPDDKPVAFMPIAGDAAKAGGLASEPIAVRGDLEGELTPTVGGGPVTVPIALR